MDDFPGAQGRSLPRPFLLIAGGVGFLGVFKADERGGPAALGGVRLRVRPDSGQLVPVGGRPTRCHPCSWVWAAIAVRTQMLVLATPASTTGPRTVVA